MGGMFQDFKKALELEIADLLRSPGEGGHFHFDIPTLRPLVPSFQDASWVSFAQQIAQVISEFETHLLLAVPLTTVDEFPNHFDLAELKSLDPWEPPAIYAPSIGSVRHLRLQSPWYTDDVPQLNGAYGWVSATELQDHEKTYGLTLRYENAHL